MVKIGIKNKERKLKMIRLLYLYPDILNSSGDEGNIKILQYRCDKRNIEFKIDKKLIEDEVPNFNDYDIIYISGLSDEISKQVIEKLEKYKEFLKKSKEKNKFFLLIGSGYQLLGKNYKTIYDEIKCLNIFDYETELLEDDNKRCLGNTIIETELNNEKIEIIGFTNHRGQTTNVKKALGKVLVGKGNSFDDKYEGYFDKNVIATYLGGPLLSKSPELSDYIIKTCLKNKKELERLDDRFEKISREQLIKKFKNNKK